MEVLFFAVPGTTDLHTDSHYYAMEGVSKFLEHSMMIDPLGFLCKMEEYALQGIHGEFVKLISFNQLTNHRFCRKL